MGTKNGVSPMVCGHHNMSYRVVQVTARTGHGTAPRTDHTINGHARMLSVPARASCAAEPNRSTRCGRPLGENPLEISMGMWDVYADVDILFLIVTSYGASWVNV